MELERKKQLVQNLYQNKDFQELILGEFIDSGIHNLCMTENVSNIAIQEELKARKCLSDWMYGIIDEAEIAEIENKDK